MSEPIRKQAEGFTYADYRSWPEDERWELIHGVAYNMCAAANRYHQEISGELFYQIRNYLKGHDCMVYAAPFDVLLPEAGQAEDSATTVVQPDISVICDSSKLTVQGCTGAPDLVVEILSPYTAHTDMEIKFRLYESHGIREYWIVDPGNRYVHVFVLDDAARYPETPTIFFETDTISCTAIPGLDLSLREVFGT